MLSGRFRRGGGTTFGLEVLPGPPVDCGLVLPESRPARVGDTGECMLCEREGRSTPLPTDGPPVNGESLGDKGELSSTASAGLGGRGSGNEGDDEDLENPGG